MDPTRQNLEGLLRLAIQAGSHGDAPQEPTRDFSSEERAWLNEAITAATSGGVNIVDEIKKSLDIISKYLDNETPSHTETVNCSTVLENISELCENQDIANDFAKINGFQIIFRCLKHQDSEIRWRAMEIIGSAAQNNEYNQKVLLDNKGLDIAMTITDKLDEDPQVRIKSFYALSCIVRSSGTNMSYFESHDGFDVVIRALQSGIKKLEMKAIFFMRALCTDDPKLILTLSKHGIPEQLVNMIVQFSETPLTEDSLDLLENILSTLHTMAISTKEIKLSCENNRLTTALHTIANDLLRNHQGRKESIEFATSMYKLLNNVEEETDR